MRMKQRMKQCLKKHHGLAVFAAFFLLTIFMTWPLLMGMDGFLLPQEYKDISHSDSIQHISKINETKNAILENEYPVITDKTDVSQIYIFLGLFFTEMLGFNEVVYHNLFFLMVILSSGLFMYYFMLELSNDKKSSFIAGLVYLTSCYVPYAYYWGHSNTMQIEWIPLIFLMFERMVKYREVKYAVYLGLSVTLQILSSSQTTVYLSFLLPLYFVLRILFVNKKQLLDGKFYLNGLLAIITVLISSSFYLLKKLGTSSTRRTIEENMRSYWRINSLSEIISINSHLYMGAIQLILVLIGIILVIQNFRNERYRQYAPFAVLFILVLLCMFGPFSFFAPYYILFKFWPYFDRFRVPFRMFPYFLLSASVLTGMVVNYVYNNKFWKKFGTYFLIIILLFMMLQILLSPWLSNLHIYYI